MLCTKPLSKMSVMHLAHRRKTERDRIGPGVREDTVCLSTSSSSSSSSCRSWWSKRVPWQKYAKYLDLMTNNIKIPMTSHNMLTTFSGLAVVLESLITHWTGWYRTRAEQSPPIRAVSFRPVPSRPVHPFGMASR